MNMLQCNECVNENGKGTCAMEYWSIGCMNRVSAMVELYFDKENSVGTIHDVQEKFIFYIANYFYSC